ncbi:MAG: hypothetical protein IT425_00480 [Pirellulales bacterium]|nr:hypothetical protein [Pirellulales bacterium]
MFSWLVIASCLIQPAARVFAESGGGKPQVLYLHTEFLPYPVEKKLMPFRMSREVVRQAFLIAARDELGLQTCDETLRETPPDDAEVIHLLLSERSYIGGKWHLKLYTHEEGQSPGSGTLLWEKTYKFKLNAATMYSVLSSELRKEIAGEFVAALGKAGFRKAKHDAGGVEPPSGEIEQLLLKPDVVAQFSAVRAAHQAIAAKGESVEWLSVLARGYGNLAALTHHYWNSTSEVFAARGWHYGYRAVAAYPESDLARWSLAYAWSTAGAFHRAVAVVKEIEKQREEAPEAPAPQDPIWTKLIEPYARSRRDAIRQVGAEHAELKPWATYLHFQLSAFARYPVWMYQAGREVASECPTAYGAYGEMALHGGFLAVIRTGASLGPRAYGNYLPLSLAAVPALPESVRNVLPTDEAKSAALVQVANDPNPDDEFSALAPYVASKLREESRTRAEGDLSWSVLAALLEEEQFVQAANYLEVALNATESSHKEEVDSILPLVKGHRYAPYIESFYYNNRLEPEGIKQAVAKAQSIQDPRNNMIQMFIRLYSFSNAAGEPVFQHGYENRQRNFTVPGIIEMTFPHSTRAALNVAWFDKVIASELQSLSPGSEIALRFRIQSVEKPKPTDLKGWEEKLREDPEAYNLLGNRYVAAGDTASAIRCYEKSLASLPDSDATIALANLYLWQGDEARWQQTLLDFTKTVDLGLQHAVVYGELAGGLMKQGRWKEAKPYALQAAQTWSGNGLDIGMLVCEGLAEWEESEHWARELSTSYPSSSGESWYFWCRRTGRGDVEKAGRLAAQYFSQPIKKNGYQLFRRRGLYQLLTGDMEGSLKSLQEALAIQRTISETCLVVLLARELKNEPARAEAIAALDKLMAEPDPANPRIPEVDQATRLVLELINRGSATQEDLTKIDAAIERFGQVLKEQRLANQLRGSLNLIIGTELEIEGQLDKAKKYWRRTLNDLSADRGMRTLAGAQLAKLQGTSRADEEVLTAEKMWPPVSGK